MFLRARLWSSARVGSSSVAYLVNYSGPNPLTGYARNFIGADLTRDSSGWTNFGMKLGLVRSRENITLPYSLHFKNSIHAGKNLEDEARTPPRSSDFFRGFAQDKEGMVPSFRGFAQDKEGMVPSFRGFAQDKEGMVPSGGSMDYVQSLLGDRRSTNASSYTRQLESNADVVRIKLMRNNAFVTVTDSKGNRKIGMSAGQVAGKGAKLTRYSGEAAAESIGRRVRQMKTKSVVVKVNGHCAFKKKRDSILSFRDGFSNSRLDVNPVVYVEDTTRKPHNGCRRPKRRRI